MVVVAVVVCTAGCWQKCTAWCIEGVDRAVSLSRRQLQHIAQHGPSAHARGGEANIPRIEGGLRGCVLLFAGDVLLMCCSFQECMRRTVI